MSSTRVSIVVPTYGRADSLRRLLAKLALQSHSAHEVLIIDQNNPGWLNDELGSVLDGSSVIWSEKANASTARNLGFVRSTGDVVLFLDDDMVPEPEFVAFAVARLDAHRDVGCLCALIVTDSDDLARATDHIRVLGRGRHPKTSDLVAMGGTWGQSAAMFFRRETYEKSGGFDELLFEYARAGEDQEFAFRMTARKLKIWVDSKLVIFHDESVPGGCELRTRPFWESRKRAIRSNVLRARLHARGHLGLRTYVRLVRTAFLNTAMIRNSPSWTLRNARLLADAVLDTRRLLRDRGLDVPDHRVVDHLSGHRERLRRARA